MKKIIVFTSKINFVWASMQEILPAIEHEWKSINAQDYEVQIISLDQLGILQNPNKFLIADCFIFTCFNKRVARMMYLLRKDFGLQTPFFIYVHGMASIFFWPLFEVVPVDLFHQGDIFVSSSKRDIEMIKLTFPKAKILSRPFSLLDTYPKLKKTKKRPFVYIGRLSEQKQIHTLLWSYYLLKKKLQDNTPPLYFYGKFDNYGSPNMGMKSNDFQVFIQYLVKLLKLQSDVFFKGFIEREKLYTELGEHIFVSASTHSDENFGMAAYRSLSLGQVAVLSDWGGHATFNDLFENGPELVPIELRIQGPVVNPYFFANILQKALDSKKRPIKRPYKFKFNFKEQDEGPMEVSFFAKELLQRKNKFKEMKIFEDYADLNVHKFFEAYGAKKQNITFLENNIYHLTPWTKLQSNIFKINDPYRGKESYILEAGNFILKTFDGENFKINRNVLQKLYDYGQVFKEETF